MKIKVNYLDLIVDFLDVLLVLLEELEKERETFVLFIILLILLLLLNNIIYVIIIITIAIAINANNIEKLINKYQYKNFSSVLYPQLQVFFNILMYKNNLNNITIYINDIINANIVKYELFKI